MKIGEHTLEADAEIDGKLCSKSYSPEHQVRKFIVGGKNKIILPSTTTAALNPDKTNAISIQNDNADTVNVLVPPLALPGVEKLRLEVVSPQVEKVTESAILICFRVQPNNVRLARKGQVLVSSPTAG